MLSNIFRLKLFLLLTLLTPTLMNAINYNEDILNIYAKMVPRFVIMSSQKNKIKDKIEICILHEQLDERVANLLNNNIKRNYPDGLLNNPLHITQSYYRNLQSCKESEIVFMFNTNKTDIDKTVKFLQENKILSMSYDISLLEKGADISLFIGRKVVPYINMKSASQKKIIFDNLLIRVSKIYMEGVK